MPPKENPKKYSRIFGVVTAIVGVLMFVVIFSLAIYGGGNLLIGLFDKSSIFNNEVDSITSGDVSILNAIEDFIKQASSTQIVATSPVALPTTTTNYSDAPYSDTQYVIFSLDGSRSLNMWNETRQFSKDMIAKGKPIHFTYFINPIYLITREKAKSVYQPPRDRMGGSLIGYANNEQDVKNRVEQIDAAFVEGHEIGSHNVGHFNGSKWSKDEWIQESNSFDSIIANVQKNNPNVVIPAWSFGLSEFVGFRAPELGVNNNLYKALAEKKYLYDSSGMRMPTKYPTKDKDGIWHIGLGIIKVKDLHSGLNNPKALGRTSYVLSMDYNFWMAQSKVKNVAKKGTPLWNSFYSEMKDAYLDYFNKNYEGNHAPVVIGHHFSTWNDGVYWEAMKSFAEDVCGKPKVKCVTFKEYVGYLNSTVK